MSDVMRSGCAHSDLAARYVAGTLPEPEAEAFEEHFFGCEECWREVERARSLRAAFAAEAGQPGTAGRAVPWGRGAKWRWPVGLAIAAGLVALLVVPVARRGAPLSDAVRGGRPALDLHVDAPAGLPRVAWRPVRGAAFYRVRLFDAVGTVVVDRIVNDTSLSLASRPAEPGADRTYYWQVVALDGARRPLASSRLHAATGTGARPPPR